MAAAFPTQICWKGRYTRRLRYGRIWHFCDVARLFSRVCFRALRRHTRHSTRQRPKAGSAALPGRLRLPFLLRLPVSLPQQTGPCPSPLHRGRLQGDVPGERDLHRRAVALIDQGVVALPIHDALVVPSSKASIARMAMLGVFKEQMGVEGMGSIEGDQ